jgi:hypothetical protein
MKIFDDLCQKLDLIRKIGELCDLIDSQPNLGQQANQLVQMDRCDSTGSANDEVLQFLVHSQ